MASRGEEAPTTASTSSGLYSSSHGLLGTRARGAACLLALADALPSGSWGGAEPHLGTGEPRSDGAAAAAATLGGEWEEEAACERWKGPAQSTRFPLFLSLDVAQ